MAIKIVNTGTGKILDDTIISYSYKEDATSLDPSDISGGVSQVSINAIEIKSDMVGSTHPNSKLMINNSVTLTDSIKGSVDLKVDKVSTTNSGVVSFSGSTVQRNLNVIKKAAAFTGSLKGAIDYYCGLCSVTPVYFNAAIGVALSTESVNFMGWEDNVWVKLKELASAYITSGGLKFEIIASQTGIVIKQAMTTEVTSLNISEISQEVNVTDAAKNVDVNYYLTSYGTNKVFYDVSNYEKPASSTDKKFLSSYSASFTVDAGQTVKQRVKIDATLNSVNQPVCVAKITQIPYTGTTGQYVIVGNDDLVIKPEQWIGQGGSLTVALTDVPDEIEITVVAPPALSLPLNDDANKNTYGPYKIGVESSGGTDYPALWLTGTGVFYEKKTMSFITGAGDSVTAKNNGPTIDNIFINTASKASTIGVVAAQALCGPDISISIGIADTPQFGALTGATYKVNSNEFRIISVEHSYDKVSVVGKMTAQFSDFNSKWTSKTFTNFTSIALNGSSYPNDALRFNEFTVIPLMESA
jgi:hypothetical protein